MECFKFLVSLDSSEHLYIYLVHLPLYTNYKKNDLTLQSSSSDLAAQPLMGFVLNV